MQKNRLVAIICLIAFAVVTSGCIVRNYTVQKDRVDQTLSPGNRGYIQGNVPASVANEKPAKTTRTVHVTEIELKSPVEFKKGQPPSRTEAARGEEMKGVSEAERISGQAVEGRKGEVISYKVQKGDTLQKISMKFFNTTKKWTKIYEANKDVLKSPQKIYPGQVIKIVK